MKCKLFFILLSCFGSSYVETGFSLEGVGEYLLELLTEDTRPAEPTSSFTEEECFAYDGKPGRCRLLVQCSTHVAHIPELSRSPCTITADQQGVCCPQKQEQYGDPNSYIGDEPGLPTKPTNFPEISSNSIDEMSTRSIATQFTYEEHQKTLAENNILATRESATFWHARFFTTTTKIFTISRSATTILHATFHMKTEFNLDKHQAENGLPHFNVKDTVISDRCPEDPVCPESSNNYRTIDGTCNNMRNSDWGKVGISLKRLIPADYDDGVSVPRKSTTGTELPSARLVSTNVSQARDNSYAKLDRLLWQWGQFLTHDITFTPISKGHHETADVTCCDNGRPRPETELDPNCLPIEIPANDGFYGNFDQTCMDFVRSMTGFRPSCTFGPREQIDQTTSYIDASQVYGSSIDVMNELRSFQDGKLKVTNDRDRELLPPNEASCSRGQLKCFLAGDSRVNEQPDLALMHTIFMRQHNIIVEGLAQVNPQWNDEILFQEGRRILGAQMQHITYNEYLPIVLGKDFMEKYGLLPLEDGVFEGYREDVDATIFNAFTTAAFRYGHSQVTGDVRGFDRFYELQNKLVLSETQFAPYSLYAPETINNLIRGLSFQNSQKSDLFFTKQLTEKLFAQNPNFGLDLVSLNIQRGRDHGLPGYTKWRKDCNLSPVTTWDDLQTIMRPEVIESMQEVYASVDDVDLFIGGLAEKPVPNALVGETFHCILGKQFIKLKIGDRFYYENGNARNPTLSQFTVGQLAEIRKTTLSRILCDNSDNIEAIQPLPFSIAEMANELTDCNADTVIPRLNLVPWREE